MSRFDQVVRLAEAQYGLVTAEQLRRTGYTAAASRHLVSRGQLRPVRSGLYRLRGVEAGWHAELMAACLSGSGRALASHRSACRLWRLRTVDDEVEVTVRYPQRLRLPNGLVHRSRDIESTDWSWVDGIPLTSVVRTLVDAGSVFPQHEVMRMVDHAVALGLASTRDLWAIRDRVGRQGRNGCGVLGQVLADLPAVAEHLESGLEVALARIVESDGLPRPVYQHQVVAGGRPCRLDAAYPRQKVFIESDGASVHSGLDQIAADGGRQNALVTSGWIPLRFTWADLRDRPAVVARRIREALAVRR